MENMADIESRLREELNQWFPRQCADPFADFRLYYLPTTPKHDGGFVIVKERPANTEYVPSIFLNPGATIEQNMNALRNVCRGLPILSYE